MCLSQSVNLTHIYQMHQCRNCSFPLSESYMFNLPQYVNFISCANIVSVFSWFLLQKSLSPAIQHQILSQLKSLSDLSDCLAVLVIAIGFLVSSPCQPDMRISKYLHTTLSLPPEKGIQASPKVCIFEF